MRIAVISASRIPSRAANSIQVMKVCQSFLDLGHAVHLWVPSQRPEISSIDLAAWYGLRQSIPMSYLPVRTALRRYDFAWKAVRLARRWQPDLVYCWPLQAAALSAVSGLPTALEVHDRPQGRFGPALMGLFLKGPGARRLLPITAALREWLATRYEAELREPFCIVAPMGVDLEQFLSLPEPETARAELGLEQGFTAGYAGHLYEGRGLELMAELAAHFPQVRFLWIGGEPPAVERWREALADRNLSNVRLTGFVPNEQLPRYQAACEVLLMPYQRVVAGSSGGDTASFASPMKAFEYLASGRAILSSDLPVLREVLDENIAVLLPPDDREAWRGALAALIADDGHRGDLAAAARERSRQYSWIERAQRALSGITNE